MAAVQGLPIFPLSRLEALHRNILGVRSSGKILAPKDPPRAFATLSLGKKIPSRMNIRGGII